MIVTSLISHIKKEVDTLYYALIGWRTLNQVGAVVSTSHMTMQVVRMMKVNMIGSSSIL